jgi:hypothetical protein
VVLDEGVVRLTSIADTRRLCALELDDPFQPRSKGVEVGVGPGLGPRLLGQGGGAGDLFHQTTWQADITIVLSPQLPDVDRGW